MFFIPTTPLQARGVAGLASEYPEEKWQGLQLVRRGYIVWCPRNYINTEGEDWSGNAARVRQQHPDWTGLTRMVWDAIRAADFLASLPEVDIKRLGCLGHSLGGKEVLFAMAFDERYHAGVSSEGGIGLDFSNWEAPWYLGPKIRQPGFDLDNHQVLALAAPRAIPSAGWRFSRWRSELGFYPGCPAGLRVDGRRRRHRLAQPPPRSTITHPWPAKPPRPFWTNISNSIRTSGAPASPTILSPSTAPDGVPGSACGLRTEPWLWQR